PFRGPRVVDRPLRLGDRGSGRSPRRLRGGAAEAADDLLGTRRLQLRPFASGGRAKRDVHFGVVGISETADCAQTVPRSGGAAHIAGRRELAPWATVPRR